MSYPDLAVLIPTYNRGRLLAENLDHLARNLIYPGKVDLFIGDDSDNDALAFEPVNLTGSKFSCYYARHTERKGLGANLNWLCTQARDYTLAIALDDDHRLVRLLDISSYVEKLLQDNTAGWIRLMGTGAHNLEAKLEGLFWRVSWNSPELYIASFRAHLFKLQQWLRVYGPFPEGLKLGQTEEIYNHLCIDMARMQMASGLTTLDVLVPLQAPEDCWSETGHSWQLEGF